MHADEAVQAARSRELWQKRQYKYDPNEFHGPTLQFATLARLRLGSADDFSQTTEATFRIVPVLFGAASVLLVWLLRDAIGPRAAVCAALLLAVSPAGVFYARYYIHETLLTCFTLAAIGAAWRYRQTGRLGWCLTAGVSVGLMQATKETAAIAYLAAAVATAAAFVGNRPAPWRRNVALGDVDTARPNVRTRHLVLGVIAALVVAALLLSSFLANPSGPVDGVLAYGHWFGRAGHESIHSQQWTYFVALIGRPRGHGGAVWSEGLILVLATVGTATSMFPKRGLPAGADPAFVRWLAVFTIAMTAVYSAIPYKTPWCVLGMLQGMTLLASVGLVAMLRLTPKWPLKVALAVACCFALGHLTWQSYRVSFVVAAEPTNPYAYAPTMPDVVRLSNDVDQLVAVIPQGESPPVEVVWHDRYYWPLPWYLRRIEHVGYADRMPPDPSAPLVIATPQFDAALTDRLDETHLMTGYYAVRPNVLAQLWVRMDVWESHLRRLGRL